MKYSVDVERSIYSLVDCLRRVQNKIYDIDDWYISIDGGTDYGIYFNFDLENKKLEISNQPDYDADDSLYLDDIIEMINEDEED